LPTVTLHESRSTLVVGTKPVAINSTKPHTAGTTFSVALNRAASVTLYFVRHHGGKSQLVGAIHFAGRQGSNKVYFDGRLKGKAVPVGSYTVVGQAVNAGGTSSLARKSFTIKPKPKPKH
jgi:hypothetical protein